MHISPEKEKEIKIYISFIMMIILFIIQSIFFAAHIFLTIPFDIVSVLFTFLVLGLFYYNYKEYRKLIKIEEDI